MRFAPGTKFNPANKILSVKTLILLVTALTGSILAVWLLGSTTVEMEGIEFKAGLSPGRSGITELHFPPFGMVEAKTHHGPVKLVISLEQIRSDTFKSHVDNPPDQKKLLERLRTSARAKITAFALHQVLVAGLGAFLLLLLLWRPGLVKTLLYSAISVLILVAVLAGVFRSYDTSAFHEPEYTGVISMAPAAVKFASDSLTDFQQIRSQTRQIVSNLGMLFSSADSLMVMANPEEQGEVVKVLLVSDLHSNPVGIELCRSLAARFKVDFLINSGDLTDMGSKLETNATQQLTAIGVPQLFVAGNHDSPETIAFINSLPDSQILNGQTITLKGLKIIGFADPLSSGSAVTYENAEQEKKASLQQMDSIKEAIKVQGRPDILVVHDYKLGRKLTPLANLVVSGHNHRIQIEEGSESEGVFANPGTTGASGLRGLYSESGISYSAAIAYIIPGNGLLAVDIIKYSPATQQFSLERKLLNAKPGAQ
ncbi:Metallo-dependent phosphatase-like [Syntrophomonas zehnderi OL-4]|uniref:Metallo-dependent phosphatase-like n=1 Tax=Syntrophomonas zehnderi OL-4 TaxID=690567 RepID=A0A0E3W3E0_9FIRM|nr:metallophosphoesterase family protein [Syntrophomonas zehnderi]CFX75444.1 Metallo-dependent phosphatase-like [Syntrophomonas zehnderi OL-4]